MFGKKYEIMKDYTDNLDNLLDEYIFCLTFRYSYMDSGNQQLAISHYIKDMFRKYTRKMIETKVPRKIVDDIVEDIKLNLKFEKVIVYQPIKTKMLWD
jgi:hypothetical protein